MGGTNTADETALAVQDEVDVVGRRFRSQTESRSPRRSERLIVGVAALGTRPVSRGQRDRLVKEEQFGVTARPHDLPTTAAELQHAHEPTANLMAADQDEVV